MRRLLELALVALIASAAGCGAQQALLGTQGAYLFTVMDALALPGRDVQLRCRLQAGDLLQGRSGYVMRFYRDGRLFKAAETDADGAAAVSFTPQQPGDYRFTAEVAPIGLSDEPPGAQQLLVACRDEDAPMAVVDMDKTIVASGFQTVLIGEPAPMAGSAELLQRLAQTHTIVYLTHRPDYFGPKSKAWLREHGYPSGPVLLSSMRGFLKGSGAFKSEMLQQLRGRFKNFQIGIGDKVSDALAYHDNGLKAFLIIRIGETDEAQALEQLADALEALPEAVQVVTGWDQIEKALFEAGSYPPSAARRRLRDLAEARKQEAGSSKDK